MGSTDPNTPIANGWLRASHRRLDPQKSKPYRPYHPHDRAEPLTPGEVYECDVEIVTSCIVVPAGWRVALTIRGKDYEYEGELSEFGKKFHYGTRGTGGMTHNDPDNRARPTSSAATVTLHAGGRPQSYLLLPIIPPRRRDHGRRARAARRASCQPTRCAVGLGVVPWPSSRMKAPARR